MERWSDGYAGKPKPEGRRPKEGRSPKSEVPGQLFRALPTSGFRVRPSFGLGTSAFGPPPHQTLHHANTSLLRNSRPPSPTASGILKLFTFAVTVLLAVRCYSADKSGGDAVECANLIYAGTKSSVCFSEEFLSTVASETSINTSRKFKAVKLGEREVFRFPFAAMTGEGSFTLMEEERKNLKLYLEKGGFLVASAGCSSKEWGESFVREIKAIFPDRKMDEVPMTHPIFRTLFDVPRLDTKQQDAKLFGLSINGKIVLIYSPDGLNDTETMHGCCCCGGNEIKNSQKVNANILVYALLQ